MRSVIRDWAQQESLAIQGVLCTAVRGPDGMPKHDPAKPLVRALRYTFMNNAHDPGAKEDDDFMGDFTGLPLPRNAADEYFSNHDQDPHHWLMHFIHASEIIGYKHPDLEVREYWRRFYFRACQSFHMAPETSGQMAARLAERHL